LIKNNDIGRKIQLKTLTRA